MTENNILNLILKEERFDFPLLDIRAISLVSKTFAGIIFDNSKQNSVSNERKKKILKFINLLVKKHHNLEDSDDCIDCSKCFENNRGESARFFRESENELKDLDLTLASRVKEFNKRRNKTQQKKANSANQILKYEKANIPEGFIKYQVNFQHYYETREDLIDNLLAEDEVPHKSNREDVGHRIQHVKYGYALVNSDLKKNLNLIDSFCEKLKGYEHLLKEEKNFISYLFHCIEEVDILLELQVVNKFSFILEEELISLCSEIIKISNAEEIKKLWLTLNDRSVINKIRDIVLKSDVCRNMVFLILFELYKISFCNGNILKLYSLLNKD